MKLAIQGVAAAITLALVPVAAHAQSVRTFVSGGGVDSGSCSISAPCRSFAYAVTQTAANGELVVKDGAGYGPVTITQSITIANDGVGTASIAVPYAGIGIHIAVPNGGSVHLRGIEIDGNIAGQTGILVSSSTNVEIVNCIVRHMTAYGMQIERYAPRVIIDNSRFDDNEGAGIETDASGGIGTITRTSISNNGAGVASQTSGQTVSIRDSVLANNQQAILVNQGNVLLSHSVVVGNNYGLTRSGGQLVSYGDNNINFNGTDTSGTITKYSTE